MTRARRKRVAVVAVVIPAMTPVDGFWWSKSLRADGAGVWEELDVGAGGEVVDDALVEISSEVVLQMKNEEM